MGPQTDLPYNFDSSVTSKDNTADVDHNNKSILVKHLKEIDELIVKHNTFDVINPADKLGVENQILAHKLFVMYLRLFRDDLAQKVEELTNGR